MRRDDYWNLFWATGMPEFWMLSRPELSEFGAAERTVKGMPHGGTDLPGEVQQLYQKQVEQGISDMPGPT